MNGRSRQKWSVLLLVLVVALSMVGCGGGDEEEEAPVTTAATAAPSGGSGGGSDAKEELVQVVPPDGEAITDEIIRTTDDTPTAFVDALVAGRPIVIAFYVTGAADDTSVMETLDRLEPSFSRYVFLRYNFSLPDQYGDISTLLEVTYPPELILIDREGIIRTVWSGYVDEGSLQQSLVNLGRE